MEFDQYRAARTLLAALEALDREWERLDAGVLSQLVALYRSHGPAIELARTGWEAGSRAVALLRELWEMRGSLPEAVLRALQEGQAAVGASVMRGGGAQVSAEERKALVVILGKRADLRVYTDPHALSQEITGLIDRNEWRLEPGERTAWQALKMQGRSLPDLASADAYLDAIGRLLGGYPRVAALLEAGKGYERRQRSVSLEIHGQPFGRQEAWRGGGDFSFEKGVRDGDRGPRDSPAAAPPPALERYGNVYFPQEVLLTQKWIPLVVHIALEYAGGGTAVSQGQAAMQVAPGDLTLFLKQDDFVLESAIGGQPLAGLPVPNARVVKVERDRDSEPVVFFLTPRTAGRKRISVDVFQSSSRVASLSFEAEVVGEGALDRPGRVAFEPLGFICAAADASARFPDLELRVSLGGDDRLLTYEVRSPAVDGLRFRFAGQRTLRVPPMQILQPYFDRLSNLARKYRDERAEAATQEALRDLRDIGTNLYDELFTDALRAEYLKLRGTPGAKSLLIVSDEPWIPWEMVRGYGVDERGQPFVDPPLCEMFQLSRWLPGPGAPGRFAVDSGVLVIPPDDAADRLAAVSNEKEYLLGTVNRLNWEVRLEGPFTAVVQVTGSFEAGQTRLYHFSCHGNVNTEDINESKLRLAGGFLRPSQITGPVRLGLIQARPLVFLNACHGGRAGLSLTQLGGWAERFLAAGASAFIGAQWEVRDELAAQFSREFYDRLWGLGRFQGDPQPLAAAFYGARVAIKEADPANSTWLAYVLYGDPNGQVIPGDRPS